MNPVSWMTIGLSFTASLVAVFSARRFAERARLLDMPNERSSHKVPVPRVGGVGLLLGIGVSLLSFPTVVAELRWALLGTVALAILGFVDDVRGLRTSVRFLTQLLICILFVYFQPLPNTISVVDIDLDLGGFASMVYALGLMWLLNLFNFMDGIDGLAGSQIAFAALFFWLTTGGVIAPLALMLLGAAFGFLVWNWPRAKVFMGDAGSTSIGFLLGAMALQASPRVPLAASGLVLLPFIFDASFTLVRRTMERRRVWEAHRSHIYQLPQAWGVSNTTVLYAELGFLGLQLGFAVIYVQNASSSVRWSLLAVALADAALISISVLRHAKKAAQGVQW